MSIDEQIEYMESELAWYKDKVDSGRSGWWATFKSCEAILKTLKQVKADKKIEDLCN